MKPKVIKTQAEYKATLGRIDEIFDAKPGTAKGEELELLLLLVETYEDKAYPIDPPDPARSSNVIPLPIARRLRQSTRQDERNEFQRDSPS
jgi:HTH-type transcriptional regulator/antitoxin HigA